MGFLKPTLPPPGPPADAGASIKADWGGAAADAAAADAAVPPPPALHRTLTALTAEYDRLKAQQRVLEAAVAEHAAVVARPRVPPRDLVGALAPRPPPDAPRKARKAPGVSGGMTALPIADDLLTIDFTADAAPPPEFRAAPFDAAAPAADSPRAAALPAPGDVIAADDVGDLLATVLAQQRLILRLLADRGGGGGGGEGLAAGAVARLRADGVL